VTTLRSTESAAGGRGTQRALTPLARVYVAAVAVAAALAAIPALSELRLREPGWGTFAILALSAGGAWLYVVPTGRNHGFHVATVFVIAGALLLPPQLVALLAVGQHLFDWITRRYPWYIQTFNTGNYTLNVLAAWGAAHVVRQAGFEPHLTFALAALAASVVMVALNHLLLATALLLARGHSFRESDLFSAQSLSTDLVLAAVGAAIAAFWQTNPYLIVLAVAPLLLIQRSFSLLARLRESEGRFRAIFDSSAMGIRLTDLAGRVLASNGAFVQMLGREEADVVGKMFGEFTDPDDAEVDLDQFGKLVAGEQATYQLENRLVRKDGERLWCLVTNSLVVDPDGQPTFALAMVEDVTERKKLEEQLQQAQKMEAIGRLAGGIAHDFNNLLTVVETYSTFALQQIGTSNPQLRSEIEEIKKAGDQASALTRQLLALGRRQVLKPAVLDLNSVVAETYEVLRRLIGENIEVVIDLAPSLGAVKADRGQLGQVLINLALNARDAMANGGKLELATANVEIETRRVQNGVCAEAGSYVVLTVTDTGCGIDGETLPRILEPFFTTKEIGKGTGLGLSTVYGIILQSGGAIFVSSEVGQGTVVEIYLPRTSAPAWPEAGVEQLHPAPKGGAETVLLVEDEDVVRGAARRILSANGYRVLEAFDASEALRIANSHAGAIDLIVTDVVMPNMGGPKLVEQLGEVHPALKVLYMSGHTGQEDVAHGVSGGDAGFLQKPFAPDALAGKVREILDATVVS
jgi:two-component system cell cycle sensor histidine kinase/response regulator CckA